ncbi:DWNN domain-containing protein, partial [Piptocephalis cylindrospora]
MSLVYYKFKSAKNHDHITFDGTGISVFDLKREIILAKRLGKGTDFDLGLYHPHTDEEYRDDNGVIPRASSVIVRRLPPFAPGKGNAQRYVNGALGNGPVGRGDGGGGAGGGGGGGSGGDASASEGPGNEEDGSVPAPGSEEAKLQGFFQSSSDQWKHQQERMAEATPVAHSGGAGGASRGGRRMGQGGFDRPPPASYVCYRCGQKGHYIQNCPTNGDKSFDKPRIRRTTGIPRSFLRSVDIAPEEREGGVMVTPDGGLVVATPDSKAWDQITARNKAVLQAGDEESMEIPHDLACPHIRPQDHGRPHLLREAVQTLCCQTKYCDECIREALVSQNFTCPSCGTHDQSPETLSVDYASREAVDAFL